MNRYLTALAVIIVIFLTSTGCQPASSISPEAEQALAEAVSPLVENSLQGLSANNYEQHIRDFDEDMRDRVDSVTFPLIYTETIGVLGAYQSSTFDHIDDGGTQFTAVYRATFANDPEALVYVVFWKAGPGHQIASLWIDSRLLSQ